MWLVLNIHKDKIEHAELIRNICMHIRPEAYVESSEGESTSTDFATDIEAQLGRKLSPDERMALGIIDDEDIDIIQREPA